MILFEEQTQRNNVLGHSVITDVFTHKCGWNIFFEKKKDLIIKINVTQLFVLYSNRLPAMIIKLLKINN